MWEGFQNGAEGASFRGSADADPVLEIWPARLKSRDFEGDKRDRSKGTWRRVCAKIYWKIFKGEFIAAVITASLFYKCYAVFQATGTFTKELGKSLGNAHILELVNSELLEVQLEKLRNKNKDGGVREENTKKPHQQRPLFSLTVAFDKPGLTSFESDLVWGKHF